MTAPIGVTGATGHLGGLVARQLSAAGLQQRLVVRDLSRAPTLPGAEAARADYGDFSLSRSALEGVRTLFMVSAHETADRVRQHRTFVDAAVAAGVRHVVYTSFAAASPDATFTLARDHFHTERYITESGIGWTFLRDNFYLDVMRYFADGEGVIRGPAGGGRVAAVARRDVAASAAAVLVDPEPHAGATYELTGPEALDFVEIAELLSAASGRLVTFHDETVSEAYASRSHYGAAPWQVDAWVSTYTAIAAGELSAVSDDVPRLTGAPATSFATLLGIDRQ